MTDLWLPAGTALAAVALTYLFCVRPMRRTKSAHTRTGRPSGPAELDKALGQARAELARLRAETDNDPVPALSPGDPAPGAEHSRR